MLVKGLGLRHVVITSVTRDDLEDGGAGHFVKVVEEIKQNTPDIMIEVLIPDFKGKLESLKKIALSAIDILNHNIETVPRLYPVVRPQADYGRSLEVLRSIKLLNTDLKTKSGLMVGLGEKLEEVIQVMEDLRSVGCDAITIGQYLQPTRANIPVHRYIEPSEFEELQKIALGFGFKYAFCGPLVRSSYMAEEQHCSNIPIQLL